jgi:hypothetical protein
VRDLADAFCVVGQRGDDDQDDVAEMVYVDGFQERFLPLMDLQAEEFGEDLEPL